MSMRPTATNTRGIGAPSQISQSNMTAPVFNEVYELPGAMFDSTDILASTTASGNHSPSSSPPHTPSLPPSLLCSSLSPSHLSPFSVHPSLPPSVPFYHHACFITSPSHLHCTSTNIPSNAFTLSPLTLS